MTYFKQHAMLGLMAGSLLLSPYILAVECSTRGLTAASAIQQDVIDRGKRAVVQIDKALQENGEFSYTGSGFFADANGLVVTNYHVVKDARRLRIFHHLGQKSVNSENIRVLAVDPITDVALLKVVNEDLSNNKIGYLDMEHCSQVGSDSFAKNPEFVVVANSNQSRNFVTKGILGQFEWMDELIPERKKFVRPDGGNDYSYKVMTFKSEITGGNSGAPMINVTNGRLLGIATGAISKDKYLGFGVIIEHAQKMIQDPGDDKIYQLAALNDGVLPVPRGDDPYYSDIQQYETLTSENQVSISGFVRDKLSRNPVKNAIVKLYDPRYPDVQFLQASDNVGHFGFTLPLSETVPWKIEIKSHGFVTHSQNLGLLIADRNEMEVLLKDEKDFVREVTWFYAEPAYVNLNYAARTVVLKAVKSLWGVHRKPIDIGWSLCEHNNGCDYNKELRWLKVNKTSGKVRRGQDSVKLVFSEEGRGALDPALLIGDLLFYPRTDDGSKPREAQVYVYAQQDETDFNHIQGFVIHKDGGAPRENSVTITTRKLAEGKDAARDTYGYPIFVDETGYFQHRVPRVKPTESEKIQFHVESPFYRALDPEKYVVDLAAPPQQPINIKLETR